MAYKYNPFTGELDLVDQQHGRQKTEFIEGNSGGPVGPDPSYIIHLEGAGKYSVTGNPATFTLTIDDDGTIAETYVCDSGSATPAANVLNVLGGTSLAGTTPLVTSGAGNTITINAQISQTVAAADASKVGLCNFDSSMFIVDADGFVTLSGGSLAIDSVAVQTGTSPVVPTAAGLITLNGATVAAGTNPIRSNGTAANTIALEVQISQALAATDATKIGLCNFDSTDFSVDANGFVELASTGAAKTITGNSGGALSPVANNWNIVGGTSAAGTTPVATAGAGATLTINAQISQALAGTDATKIGMSNFDSTDFSVDANGFVELATTGAGKTITGDSGGALSPTSNNWNILGLSGAKTSGAVSTLTVKAPPYADAGASATSTINSGEFVTGAFTRTLPATLGLADGDLIEYVCTSASALIIQAVGAQKIRLGSVVSSVAGTATSTAIGDSISLRFRATDEVWYATSSMGIWTLA